MKLNYNGFIVESEKPQEILELIDSLKALEDHKTTKRVLTKRMTHSQWTGAEDMLIIENQEMPLKKLRKLMGNTHSVPGIACRKSKLKKNFVELMK